MIKNSWSFYLSNFYLWNSYRVWTETPWSILRPRNPFSDHFLLPFIDHCIFHLKPMSWAAVVSAGVLFQLVPLENCLFNFKQKLFGLCLTYFDEWVRQYLGFDLYWMNDSEGIFAVGQWRWVLDVYYLIQPSLSFAHYYLHFFILALNLLELVNF